MRPLIRRTIPKSSEAALSRCPFRRCRPKDKFAGVEQHSIAAAMTCCSHMHTYPQRQLYSTDDFKPLRSGNMAT